MILAGDIGGTKVNLAAFEIDGQRLIPKVIETFPSRDHASLEEIVQRFLSAHRLEIESACFGIAGPIKKNRAELTNLPWVIEGKEVARALGLKEAWLINDLEANAHGIACLESKDFVTLNQGEKVADGHIAIISAGTGLGEAGLMWEGARYITIASEGGHADFAPRTDLDIELLRYLRGRFGQVSWEHLLSGRGSFHIYEFLRDTGRGEEPAWLTDEFRRTDPPVAVTRAALEGKCALCVQAIELFVTYYGAEAANLALKLLATGGVFLGGGIAPKIISKLTDGRFLKAFVGEGRMKDLLAAMPVRVIMNDKTALIGAARFAAVQAGIISERRV